MHLTEDYIARKLQDAEGSIDSDGYAEVPLLPDIPIRCAAVLIPLVFYGDEWYLLFTRRTDRVESHKGQVSFPGGACDDGETTPEQTALREAYEEIGLNPKDVKVLGRLSPMITITNYRVNPIVGVIPWPYAFLVANIEVARVFTMPLLWLADRNNFWELLRPDSDRPIIVYHPYEGELLWGATARMTVNFLATIGVLE
jgi:8-oxo-dGTP pyrophosphatase MutT (NUDIX family)